MKTALVNSIFRRRFGGVGTLRGNVVRGLEARLRFCESSMGLSWYVFRNVRECSVQFLRFESDVSNFLFDYRRVLLRCSIKEFLLDPLDFKFDKSTVYNN